VPSAPVLVADQPSLLRALNHSESFFREVLAFDQPPVDLEKEIKKKKKPVIPGVQNMTAKEKKEAKMKQQIEEMDALVGQLYGI
jgi:cbb3-type cytochrome oxidase cytochrome c subunit